MLRLAIIFFIIALVAGGLGFFGLAAASATVAKVFFFIFVALFAITLVMGLVGGKKLMS